MSKYNELVKKLKEIMIKISKDIENSLKELSDYE